MKALKKIGKAVAKAGDQLTKHATNAEVEHHLSSYRDRSRQIKTDIEKLTNTDQAQKEVKQYLDEIQKKHAHLTQKAKDLKENQEILKRLQSIAEGEGSVVSLENALKGLNAILKQFNEITIIDGPVNVDDKSGNSRERLITPATEAQRGIDKISNAPKLTATKSPSGGDQYHEEPAKQIASKTLAVLETILLQTKKIMGAFNEIFADIKDKYAKLKEALNAIERDINAPVESAASTLEGESSEPGKGAEGSESKEKKEGAEAGKADKADKGDAKVNAEAESADAELAAMRETMRKMQERMEQLQRQKAAAAGKSSAAPGPQGSFTPQADAKGAAEAAASSASKPEGLRGYETSPNVGPR